MPTLYCKLTQCSNNNNRLCGLNLVHMDGQNATASSETHCGSFTQHRASSTGYAPPIATQNLVFPDNVLAVQCSAANCAHNQLGHCGADTVEVRECTSGVSGLCGSFRAE